MGILLQIYGIVVLWIAFNSLCFSIINNKTSYPGNTQGDSDIGIIILLIYLFGPLMFLFLKQIRLYRKHRYLKNRIQYYNMINNPNGYSGPIYSFGDNYMDNRIQKLERIYKLSLMHQKTKRNNIKKKLLLK